MRKECKHCKKMINYDKFQQFAGHLSSCKSNPIYKEKNEKISKALKGNPSLHKNTVERHLHVLECKKCGKEYTITLTQTEFEHNRFKKFCSRKCANSKKHNSETKQKISSSLLKRDSKFSKKVNCELCNNEFTVTIKNKNQKYCSRFCSQNSTEYKDKMSKIAKKRCKSLKERKRLRDIGRKGGFGKKGYTDGGVYYQSILEQQCFEFLEKNKIFFQPHKHLPKSSKVSDLYLPHLNLWIELDGINREKKKKYLGKSYDCWIRKLKLYKRKKLNLKIVYDISEFIQIFT